MLQKKLFSTSTRQGPLSDRLKKNKYSIEETKINDKLLVCITSPSGKKWITGKNTAYPMTSHAIYELSNDKRQSYTIAEKLGAVVPETVYSNKKNDKLVEQLLDRYKQIIVKPLDSYQSKGVTVGITEPTQLAEAAKKALAESSEYIAQEQVNGEEYRFTVLDGKTVSVLRRERPQIIGDGLSTMAELIERENVLRRSINTKYVKYPQWDKSLFPGVDFECQDILNKNEIQLLANVTMVSKGASIYEVKDEIHNSYQEIAEKLVQELGAGLLVVDMFIPNHAAPADQNYWFNEFNAAPSLKMYHVARNFDNSQVADKIVDMMIDKLNK